MPQGADRLRLFLARHTEPQGGGRWTILGHKDVPLTDRGRREWTRIANGFDGVPLEAIYSSDLARTRWCAGEVARMKGLNVTESPELREMDCGLLDGLPVDEARRRFPEVFEGLTADPVDYRIPEGETLREVAARVEPVIAEIRCRPARNVLVVGHAVVNRVIICDALGLPLQFAYRIEQSYGGLTVIDYGRRHPVVQVVNAPGVPPVLLAQDQGRPG